ncbi:MAG: GerMN domain-containing protein [Pyrinomonadaceae bacterium]
MKTIKPILLIVVMLAAFVCSTAAAQGWRPIKGVTPKGLVADLYRQHKTRSPFFQTRSRALLDKYFARDLANLLWQDAHSSGDEVGALDGDPLFNAQDMDIKNFSIQDGVGGPRMVVVPVSFENLGQKHEIKFRLFSFGGSGWKIANIEYDDGASLLEILKRDRKAQSSQTINIYLVALEDDGKTGKKIGCDDSLIAVTRTIKKTATPLAAAIRELLLTPEHPDGSPNLENFWKGRNLKLRSVSIVNHTATIRFSGELYVAGVCDEPRIESQIDATARQFPSVKKVKVFIGNRTLAEAIR